MANNSYSPPVPMLREKLGTTVALESRGALDRSAEILSRVRDRKTSPGMVVDVVVGPLLLSEESIDVLGERLDSACEWMLVRAAELELDSKPAAAGRMRSDANRVASLRELMRLVTESGEERL